MVCTTRCSCLFCLDGRRWTDSPDVCLHQQLGGEHQVLTEEEGGDGRGKVGVLYVLYTYDATMCAIANHSTHAPNWTFSCDQIVNVVTGHSSPCPFSKVDVHAQDNDGKSCLHWAVETASPEAIICIKLLCKRFPGMYIPPLGAAHQLVQDCHMTVT